MLKVKEGMTLKEFLRGNELDKYAYDFSDFSKEVTSINSVTHIENEERVFYNINFNYREEVCCLIFENGELEEFFTYEDFSCSFVQISDRIVALLSTEYGQGVTINLNTLEIKDIFF